VIGTLSQGDDWEGKAVMLRLLQRQQSAEARWITHKDNKALSSASVRAGMAVADPGWPKRMRAPSAIDFVESLCDGLAQGDEEYALPMMFLYLYRLFAGQVPVRLVGASAGASEADAARWQHTFATLTANLLPDSRQSGVLQSLISVFTRSRSLVCRGDGDGRLPWSDEVNKLVKKAQHSSHDQSRQVAALTGFLGELEGWLATFRSDLRAICVGASVDEADLDLGSESLWEDVLVHHKWAEFDSRQVESVEWQFLRDRVLQRGTESCAVMYDSAQRLWQATVGSAGRVLIEVISPSLLLVQPAPRCRVPPYADSRGKAFSALAVSSIDGTWIDREANSGFEVTISDGVIQRTCLLQGEDRPLGNVVFRAGDFFEAQLDGDRHTCRLLNGRLRWSNGWIWIPKGAQEFVVYSDNSQTTPVTPTSPAALVPTVSEASMLTAPAAFIPTVAVASTPRRLSVDSGGPYARTSRADSSGMGLTKSKDVDDLHGGPCSVVGWGVVVAGIDEGDGWLRLGSRCYLPLNADSCAESGKTTKKHEAVKIVLRSMEDLDRLDSKIEAKLKKRKDFSRLTTFRNLEASGFFIDSSGKRYGVGEKPELTDEDGGVVDELFPLTYFLTVPQAPPAAAEGDRGGGAGRQQPRLLPAQDPLAQAAAQGRAETRRGPDGILYSEGEFFQLFGRTDEWEDGGALRRRGEVELGGVELDCGMDFNFDSADEFSIQLQVCPKKAGMGSLVARTSGESGQGYDLGLEAGRLVVALRGQSSGGDDLCIKVASEEVLQCGVWHHVAMTYNGSRTAEGVTLYLNYRQVPAVVEKDALGEGSFATPGAALFIGRRESGSNPFEGSIADVTIRPGLRDPLQADGRRPSVFYGGRRMPATSTPHSTDALQTKRAPCPARRTTCRSLRDGRSALATEKF
ncbi:unnamed protein product, partial [Prorocentrum cordatum]